MTNSPDAIILTAVPLDPAAPMPLYQQLYTGLRGAILAGKLAAGTRLPATRTLATELHLSRNTVTNAFDQLIAEGYLEGRVGAGTYVAQTLPEWMTHATPAANDLPTDAPASHLSQRGSIIAATRVSADRLGHHGAFVPGVPALDAFPRALWATLTAQRWRSAPAALLDYSDPAGYAPLREAIAAYLATSRGVRCTAAQVIIVSGSQQAIDLTARLLLDPGDRVLVEDPGYIGARGALQAAGATLVGVPLDGEGLDFAAETTAARLAYITPSHQYPTGVVMSLQRRLALLEWARAHNAWVLEDDYDSEYRYVGRPLAALQGLDRAGRVIYTGTLSKVLAPALRLGYLVVPPDLVTAFVAARALLDRHSPTLEQAVLADFIAAGHFARHIRRTRVLYAKRQAALVAAVHAQLAAVLEVQPAEAGLHLIGWFRHAADDQAMAQRATACGIYTPPLSAYAVAPSPRPGVVLGYAATDEATIHAAVARLAVAWR